MLRGLNGANPLGFLAALGTLQAVSEANPDQSVTLAWQSSDCSWFPVIGGVGTGDFRLAPAVAEQVRCPFRPDERREQERSAAQQAHEAKKQQLKQAMELLKKKALRGNQRKEAEEKELVPIRQELAALRWQWLAALRQSVASLEISLGKHLDASRDELRATMLAALEDGTSANRAALDLLAAFGSDACPQPKRDNQMQPTPFCFITGAGHQYFLDTARQLMKEVDARRIEEALFGPTDCSDERLSMRWDPEEDRRYAIMWSDPTSSDNKATTNWALNLLAYRGLQLCTSVPTSKGLRTAGWSFEPELTWRWPIWRQGLTLDVVRSALVHPLLMESNTSRSSLSAIGVVALYEATRVQVGKYINFTPARQIA
jgi:hypothetical protein